MVPFPKNRREIRPWLADLQRRGKRFVTKNRNAVIATATISLVLVVGVTGWALSDRDTKPKKRVPYASANTTTSVKEAPATKPAAPDPLAKGRSLYESKKYDEAIDVFQPLVDSHVEARFWLGKSHLAAGHDFRGCRQLEKYVEKAPKGRYVSAAKKDLKKC